MRRAYRVHQVDVFTGRALAGNPLAVFVDITGQVRDGALTDIRVGGQGVPVLEGTLQLPVAEDTDG